MKVIYLCAPYTHWNPLVRWWRVRKVNKKAAELMDQGYIVFSPISHSDPISKHTKADACDSGFWVRQDLAFMPVVDEVWVYKLPGYMVSRGIERELKEAKALGKVVRFVE